MQNLPVLKHLRKAAVLAAATFFITASVSDAGVFSPRAFPGAEGFARDITGGRGGEVYRVTNLDDSGPGSLRDAVSEDNRIIVFDVAGWIDLDSRLTISRSNLTLAGQTAPGDGIGVRNHEVLLQRADNVIIRYIRFRHGPTEPRTDSIGTRGASNIMFDHLSAGYGRDEGLSIVRSENVSVQWSIISEGILPRAMGSLLEWGTISFHHNLYAHNRSRNPKAKGYIDFVNNVIYNWGVAAFIAGDSGGYSQANMVGNYFLAGPETPQNVHPIRRANRNFALYMEDNIYDPHRDGELSGDPFTPDDTDEPVTWTDRRFDYPKVTTQDPLTALELVLEHAGASDRRDATDQRVIDSVRNQDGHRIEHPDEVGGYVDLETGELPVDSNGNGLPDWWEDEFDALDRNNPGAANEDSNGDGYTNIEAYHHYLVTGLIDDRYALDAHQFAATDGDFAPRDNWNENGLPLRDTIWIVAGDNGETRRMHVRTPIAANPFSHLLIGTRYGDGEVVVHDRIDDGGTGKTFVGIDSEGSLIAREDASVRLAEVNVGLGGGHGTLAVDGGTVNIDTLRLGVIVEIDPAKWIQLEGNGGSGTAVIDSGRLKVGELVIGHQQRGAVQVNGGDLEVDVLRQGIPHAMHGPGNYPATLDIEGGTLTVNDTMRFSSGVTMTNRAGTLVPNAKNRVTRLFGQYTQGPDATLRIGVSSDAQAHELYVSGHATLAGELEIRIDEAANLAEGDAFVVLTGETVNETFDTVTANGLPDGLDFEVSYESQTVRVTVVNDQG